MPQATYTALANITLGSSASSVTFSNIPNTYRDLIFVMETSHGSTGEIRFQPNSDTTGTTIRMFGSGSGSGSSDAPSNRIEVGYLSSRGVCIAQLFDYAQTDKHKTVLSRWSDAANYVGANAGRWPSTSAVTSVKLTTPAGSFPVGSTFALYGVIA